MADGYVEAAARRCANECMPASIACNLQFMGPGCGPCTGLAGYGMGIQICGHCGNRGLIRLRKKVVPMDD